MLCLEREETSHTQSRRRVRTWQNPGPQHMKLGRRILLYLEGTRGLRLTYKGNLQTLRG